MKHQFPLMPLSAATSDLFKVRLRSGYGGRDTFQKTSSSNHDKTLTGKLDLHHEATSNGFKVLVIGIETSEDSAPVQDTSVEGTIRTDL